MFSISNSACRCTRASYKLSVLRAGQSKFSLSVSLRQHDANQQSAPKRAKSKTKKLLVDLPKTRLDLDGTAVPPLPAWDGGLREPSIKGEVTQTSDSSIPVLKPKRERKRKVKANQQLDKSSDSGAQVTISQPRTPLANEILANLAKFPHCVLLTRVGQFYESYFEPAADVARLLNIKLTTKAWGGERVPMCGFPLMHLDKYLKVLVQQHQRFVAICEEFMRDPFLGPKGGFDRRVTRVVTPGTLLDEPFLNPYENNYLLAIAHRDDGVVDPRTTESIGLAWTDVSTGDFFTQLIPRDGLRDQLVRINPKEVVLDGTLRRQSTHPICQALMEEDLFTSYISADAAPSAYPAPLSEKQMDDDDVTSLLHDPRPAEEPVLTDLEMKAIRHLTSFMRENLLEYMPKMPSPRREAATSRMQIDAHTIKALEIRETMADGGTTGSLLSVIKKTVTSSGTRLLARWLCSPSTSIVEINARQSLVEFFKSRPHLRTDLIQILREIEDTTRIVQRLLLGRGDTDDLVAILKTIRMWHSIQKRTQLERNMEQSERGTIEGHDWTSLEALISRMASLQALADRIDISLARRDDSTDSALDDAPTGDTSVSTPNSVAGGWTIRAEFSEKLTVLHTTLADLLGQREKLELQLQQTHSSPSLTLRTAPHQGFHVHIARTKRDSRRLKSDSAFVALAETASTSSFFYQPWSVLGSTIAETTTAIHIAEREAFEILRNEVNFHTADLRRNSRILDELDVTLAFANIAEELNFTKPIMREDTFYRVEAGRHPTVELGLLAAGRVFTPNSVSFTNEGLLHIITGPNMAGKSTLLRQTALIAILAQTGSFVPAEFAELGIVDHVFSRVGAKDDLFRDRSTFMVEMLETADILRRATPKSLVIMDEVGRGTTVSDGIAIAFATIHHLLTVNYCRAMFATHFHELADMLGYADDHKGRGTFERVQFYCTDVDETQDGFFAYSHRLRPGINRDSHGLKVAQLAGMPTSAIQVASTAISWFKQRTLTHIDKVQLRALGQSLSSK